MANEQEEKVMHKLIRSKTYAEAVADNRIPGAIYFTTDTHEIVQDGQSYGRDPAVLLALMQNKADLVNGKIPASQLPGYVDDVIEIVPVYWLNGRLYRPLVDGKLKPTFDINADTGTSSYLDLSQYEDGTIFYDASVLANVGDMYHVKDGNTVTAPLTLQELFSKGKMYLNIDTGKAFRWGGNALVEIVANPGSTDEVPESDDPNGNKYFTDQRAQEAVLGTNNTSGKKSALIALLEQSGSGATMYVGTHANQNLSGPQKANALANLGITKRTSQNGWSETPSDENIVTEKLARETIDAIVEQLTWG